LVVTDELVALAPDDDAILGVLAHELGHVQHRHVTASIIQASGLSMVAFVLWGDVSTLLAAAPVALMQATYSRESETQADTYAIHFIQAAGLRSASVAELFEAMQKQNGEEGGSVWSSHPDTGERAERFRRR
jgi:Zn-dependent protease with chaperone function